MVSNIGAKEVSYQHDERRKTLSSSKNGGVIIKQGSYS